MPRVLYLYLMALDTIYSRLFARTFLFSIASCRGWGEVAEWFLKKEMLSTHDRPQSVCLANVLLFHGCGPESKLLNHPLDYWRVWTGRIYALQHFVDWHLMDLTGGRLLSHNAYLKGTDSLDGLNGKEFWNTCATGTRRLLRGSGPI